MSAELTRELARIVGPGHVITDPDQRRGFEEDWTRRYVGASLAVIRPSSTDEVVGVVTACARHGVPMVPQGGNTGLVGGSVPGRGPRVPVVVSLTRLNRIDAIDSAAGQITVGAGVTLAALETHLLGSGWQFGVDLGARTSATIGGMVATNAGGTRVVRYGMMRANVSGLEAVLADGRVVSPLRGLPKDNTGYSLTALFTGSEGTLGIITRARLNLVPDLPDSVGVSIGCADWADAQRLAVELRRSVEGLEVLEGVDRQGVITAVEQLGLSDPLPGAAVTLVVVWAGRGEPYHSLVDVIGSRPHVVGPPRRVLEVRDRQSEAIARLGVPHKFDVSLPADRVVEFAERVHSLFDSRTRAFVFGHLGDGNLHLNVIGPEPDDDRVDRTVYEFVASLGGSISAEHGIGRSKAAWLALARSEAEIDTMRLLKRAVDPSCLMNPGVLLSD